MDVRCSFRNGRAGAVDEFHGIAQHLALLFPGEVLQHARACGMGALFTLRGIFGEGTDGFGEAADGFLGRLRGHFPAAGVIDEETGAAEVEANDREARGHGLEHGVTAGVMQAGKEEAV